MNNIPNIAMPNTDMLRRALEWIDEHPEQHDQGTWGRKTACGTAGCLAFVVSVVLHGDEPVWVCHPTRNNTFRMFEVRPQDGTGRIVDVSDRAQYLLGLRNNRDIDELFCFSNTREDLADALTELEEHGDLNYWERPSDVAEWAHARGESE